MPKKSHLLETIDAAEYNGGGNLLTGLKAIRESPAAEVYEPFVVYLKQIMLHTGITNPAQLRRAINGV